MVARDSGSSDDASRYDASDASDDAGRFDAPDASSPDDPLTELYSAVERAANEVCPCRVPADYPTVDDCVADVLSDFPAESCVRPLHELASSAALDDAMRCETAVWDRIASCAEAMGHCAPDSCEDLMCEPSAAFDAFWEMVIAECPTAGTEG